MGTWWNGGCSGLGEGRGRVEGRAREGNRGMRGGRSLLCSFPCVILG